VHGHCITYRVAAILTGSGQQGAELVNQIYYRHFGARSRIGEAYPDQVPLGTPADQIPARENLLNTRAAEQETGWRLDFFSDISLGRLSTGWRVAQLDLRYQLDLTEDAGYTRSTVRTGAVADRKEVG
jgi:hypothetical protein